ncbi:hypothetical protein D3C86_2000500 [compost metagenome]
MGLVDRSTNSTSSGTRGSRGLENSLMSAPEMKDRPSQRRIIASMCGSLQAWSIASIRPVLTG